MEMHDRFASEASLALRWEGHPPGPTRLLDVGFANAATPDLTKRGECEGSPLTRVEGRQPFSRSD